MTRFDHVVDLPWFSEVAVRGRRDSFRNVGDGLRRPGTRARVAAFAAVTFARIAFALAARLRIRRGIFQNPRPVELNIRIVLLEEPDRLLIDRCAADAHAGRRAEPIKEALPFTSPATRRFDQSRGFVSAPIAAEA